MSTDVEVPSGALAHSPRRVAKLIDLSRSGVYDEIHAGRMRAVRRNGRIFVLDDDLRAWLASLPDVIAS